MTASCLPQYRAFRILVGCIILMWCTGSIAVAGEKAATLSAPILRHRVAVVAMPPNTDQANQPNTVLVKSDAWNALLLKEGVMIKEDEWAIAVDLTKAVMTESNAFRVVEMPMAGTKSENEPVNVLLAKYGTGLNGKRVFFRLVEAKSGTVLASSEAIAASMKEAVEDALSKLQREVNLLPWRCHVVGLSGELMVIDRGRLDGIRTGQEFTGFSVDNAGAADAALPEEQRIMQYGKKTGNYKVVEEGQDFSKVQGVDKAPLLKKGDILAMPDIRLKDRTRESRGKRLWDEVYKSHKVNG